MPHAPPTPVGRAPVDADVAAAVVAVRRIVRALRLAARRVEAEAGMSAAQLFALGELAAAPAASLSELARRTLTDRSSVTAIVERLAERGLVARGRSPEDRRRETIRATARGRALVERLPTAPTLALIEGLARLPARERAAAARALGRLADAMGLADGPAPMLFEDEAAPPAPPAPAARRRRAGAA